MDSEQTTNETVDSLVESLRLVEEPKDEPAPEPAAEPAGEEKVSAEPEKGEGNEPTLPADTPPTEPVEPAPSTWRKEAQAKWTAVDPDIRKEIQKREGDIAKFVGETQPALNVAKAFEKMLEPFAGAFQQYGVNPWDHMNKLLHAHHQLVFGQPEQKVAMFKQLARDAGVDLSKLADPNAAPGTAVNQEFLQHVRGLEQRIAQLQGGVTNVTQTLQEARTAELEQGILAFANDKENHPFFWELAETGEIQKLIDNKSAGTLAEAYELAVLKNPVYRARQFELDSAKKAKEQAAADATKVAAAKKATSVNVQSRRGGKTSPNETIDDTLRNALAEIHSRT